MTALAKAVNSYTTHLEEMRFRKATIALRAIWAMGNAYLERTQPWITIRDNPDQAAGSLRTAINLIRVFAVLATPIMPTTSEWILAALGQPPPDGWISNSIEAELATLRPGHAFTAPEVPLFPKVTEDHIAVWGARFGWRGAGGGCLRPAVRE